jgi:hypothetical protein
LPGRPLPPKREAEPEFYAAFDDALHGSLALLPDLRVDAISKINVLVAGLGRAESGIREESAAALESQALQFI